MARMTYDGDFTVVSSSYVAYGDTDKSEGRGGRRELGRFTTVQEAYDEVQGEGVQGSPGYISRVELLLFEGGLTRERSTQIFGRPAIEFANHDYSPGWLNADGSRWVGPKGTHPS